MKSKGWGKVPPFSKKSKSDPIDFGAYRGRELASMSSPEELEYLKWILKQVNLEERRGDAIRDYLSSIDVRFDEGESKEVIITKEIIDRFSILFFDRWFNYYRSVIDSSLEVQGIASFIETIAFDVHKKVKGGLISATYEDPGNVFTHFIANFDGIKWVMKDTGGVLVIKEVADQDEKELDNLPDVPF